MSAQKQYAYILPRKLPDARARGPKIAGSGWKAGLGGTLLGLAAVGTKGAMEQTDPISGLIGGAILGGIGGLLIRSDMKGSGYNRRAKAFDKGFVDSMRMSQGGSGLTTRQIHQLVNQAIGSKIGMSDIFGKKWKAHSKTLVKAIRAHKKLQKGGNIFGDIGKAAKKGYKAVKSARDKSYKKLIQFAEGKTKFKPSTLLNIASGAIGLAGAASAFIPGVDLISVPAASAAALGLKSGAHLLKTSGRGMKGGAGFITPEVIYHLAISNPKMTRKMIGLALGITGAALTAAYKLYKEFGKAKKGSGFDFPESKTDLLRKSCKSQGRHDGLCRSLNPKGGSLPEVALSALAKLGDAAVLGGLAAGTYGAYKVGKKLKNRKKGGALRLAGQHRYGSGLSLSGGELPAGVSYTKTGKIKRDRYSVFYGFHDKTKSGLTKAAFVKKGNKIISKAKQAQGRKAAKYLQLG